MVVSSMADALGKEVRRLEIARDLPRNRSHSWAADFACSHKARSTISVQQAALRCTEPISDPPRPDGTASTDCVASSKHTRGMG